uniref:Uncharacterized protein n=1 Tax=Acrobeloides nanus TaxID=290746 RepID=A0A914DRP9_9BILA
MNRRNVVLKPQILWTMIMKEGIEVPKKINDQGSPDLEVSIKINDQESLDLEVPKKINDQEGPDLEVLIKINDQESLVLGVPIKINDQESPDLEVPIKVNDQERKNMALKGIEKKMNLRNVVLKPQILWTMIMKDGKKKMKGQPKLLLLHRQRNQWIHF